MSPEFFYAFINKNNDMMNNIDYNKNQIFSLGLLVLELGLMQNISDIYNYD